jgi:hypothetical protein
LINWGAKRRWPHHLCSPFAIADFQQHWVLTATFGNEDCVWMAMALCDYLDSQQDETQEDEAS